jgi:hypothetical protein
MARWNGTIAVHIWEESHMEAAQNGTPSGSAHWLERKHKKMLWAAFAADALSWIVLVFYGVLLILTLFQSFRALWMNSSPNGFQSLPRTPDYMTVGTVILSAFMPFFTGIVYTLVLRGVSLGLKMLVEIDLNYKLSREEEPHA